jgi:hypothetical protein
VESTPTSKAPARRRPDGNIFQIGARFGQKRCAASEHHPLCIPDRCRLLCARSRCVARIYCVRTHEHITCSCSSCELLWRTHGYVSLVYGRIARCVPAGGSSA